MRLACSELASFFCTTELGSLEPSPSSPRSPILLLTFLGLNILKPDFLLRGCCGGSWRWLMSVCIAAEYYQAGFHGVMKALEREKS